MANAVTPFGFRPIKNGNGSPWSGEANLYVQVGTGTGMILRIGDMVKHGGTSDVNGVPSIVRAAAGGSGASAFIGVVVGILPVTARPTSLVGSALGLETKHISDTEAANRFVLVCDNPDVIFECLSDVTGLSRTQVGANSDIVATTNTTSTVLLSQYVLLNTADDTITFPWRILGFSSHPTNEISSTDSTKNLSVRTLVRPNEHAFKKGNTGLAA